MNSANDYLRQLQALLPEGAAWARDKDGVLAQFLHALAYEFARIDARVERLINENDPRTALEMLRDWERAFGLPDQCMQAADTLIERQNILHEKVTRIGDQSRQYYVDIAARAGYQIGVTDFNAFMTGVSRTGDPLNGIDWLYAWRVNAPATTVVEFRTGRSATGDPLRDWGNDILECLINRIKPAHTVVQFAYGG